VTILPLQVDARPGRVDELLPVVSVCETVEPSAVLVREGVDRCGPERRIVGRLEGIVPEGEGLPLPCVAGIAVAIVAPLVVELSRAVGGGREVAKRQHGPGWSRTGT
jgi:hypothetical protein